MIERAIAADIPFAWVTADEAYGDNGPLRAFMDKQQAGYVLAVSCDHVITTSAGRRRAAPWQRGWRREPGSGSAVGTALRAAAGMTGPGRHRQAGDIPPHPPIHRQAV
jgi:SRSO17 transposase